MKEEVEVCPQKMERMYAQSDRKVTMMMMIISVSVYGRHARTEGQESNYHDDDCQCGCLWL